MFDFLRISTKTPKRNVIEVYPKFVITDSKDLMIRGGDFYAIWDEESKLWSTSEQTALRLIDREIEKYVNEHDELSFDSKVVPLYLWDSDSGMVDKWHKYCQKQMRDNFHMLDERIIFANETTKKKDYVTKRLPYPIEEGECAGYEKLISTLYSPEEREKIEWAIGSIITGDSKKIQKFLVLYGAAGTGKSTILNIIQDLFEGYTSVFDAKALGSSSNSFALEAFKSNPLVAIQHDGDLSRIEDNTRLNSLVSHEMMTVNEKFKSTYANSFKCFLFMGTNKPVKITDSRSGLLRRLIDVSPSGEKLPGEEYRKAVSQAKFELGAIAHHCREVYLSQPDRYDNYIPYNMMDSSNDFYNFMLDNYEKFNEYDGISVESAWKMYCAYSEDSKLSYPLNKRVFKEEFKSYFRDFDNTTFRGFRTEKFGYKAETKTQPAKVSYLINFDSEISIFDELCGDCPAQLASEKETPVSKWINCKTKLDDIDTKKLHYVKLPENHIVIDFDIPGEDGTKCYEKNLVAASKWPPTYAELSKSGAGIHLHYIYQGDPSRLSSIYDDHIEIKVFRGNSSLRRKLSKCNTLPIASISSGLPLKGEDKMVNTEAIKNEKHLRTLIKKNLAKEIHSSTRCSVDFIFKLLEDAYDQGVNYDVSDLKTAVFDFASNSTHQSDYCTRLVCKMKWKSEEKEELYLAPDDDSKPIVFYDVEVFPNLFVLNWKYEGADKHVIRMINPKPEEVEGLLKYRLVGFNNRRYDNHIIYGRIMHYSNEQLYELSQKIIAGENGAFIREAYNISYTDIYDYSSVRQSLKKWEIDLGIHHQELGLPWDQPVPENLWVKVAEYCDNDVIATEAVWNATQGDFTARKILADLAGMTCNDTTNSLSTRIIFGTNRKPHLNYVNLATGEMTDPQYAVKGIEHAFPGYEFIAKGEDGKRHNMYRGDDLGFGGYVYSEPGWYTHIALMDVQSMHPTSEINMGLFGEYTPNFVDIYKMRIFIKHKDFESAKKLMGGKVAKYLEDETTASQLAQALKLVLNSTYGMTSASFDNAFKDDRNVNNIVALRGALFMRTLQDEVQARGFKVAHIKTDSIKIPDATPEIIDFVMEFGRKYGYIFEHEATYEKMCLIDKAQYIAKYSDDPVNGKHAGEWVATGAAFQHPYIFKTLFTKEPIIFADMCETKSVSKGDIYLDMNEGLGEDEHNYIFVGRVGLFTPIKPGCNGGILYRKSEDKFYAVTGTKGYRWLESEVVKTLKREEDIDFEYFRNLVDDAKKSLFIFCDVDRFCSDDQEPWPEFVPGEEMSYPVYPDEVPFE